MAAHYLSVPVLSAIRTLLRRAPDYLSRTIHPLDLRRAIFSIVTLESSQFKIDSAGTVLSLRDIIPFGLNDDLPLLVDVAILAPALDRGQIFGKAARLVPLRFDDELALPVDVAPLAPALDCGQIFGKAARLVPLELNDDLPLRVDVAILAPALDRSQTFVKAVRLVPLRLDDDMPLLVD